MDVLVDDGLSVDAYTFNLIVPSNLNSEFSHLPTLETKQFLRDLRSGKVEQICDSSHRKST